LTYRINNLKIKSNFLYFYCKGEVQTTKKGHQPDVFGGTVVDGPGKGFKELATL
jgi:hypothetical protein